MEESFKRSVRFLLLDFGYPMAKSTTTNVKKALLNVASLMSACSSYSSFSGSMILTIIKGKSVVINNFKSLKKNYNDLLAYFSAENCNEIISVKLSIQEYKIALQNSLCKMMNAVTDHYETLTNNGNNISFTDNKVYIQLTVISKKAASLLNDILKDVLGKIFDVYATNLECEITYQIIQILSDKTEAITQKNQTFNGLICYDTMKDLIFFFKNFILQFQNEQERLKLIISKNLDLVINCDLGNIVIDPALLRLDFHLCNDFMFQLSNKHSLLGLFASVASLEILHRFPLSIVNSTLLFGIPRRVRAARNTFMNFNESYFNDQIFDALCQNLIEANEGLLAEGELKVKSFSLKVYYILTPDENTLVLNCLAPEELYLPDSFDFSSHCLVEENVISAMRTSLRQIPILNDFSPGTFSSGLYECLGNQMKSLAQNKREECRVKKFEKRKKLPKNPNKNNNVYLCTASNFKTFQATVKHSDQSVLIGTEVRTNTCENVHPALLSPKTAQKYRKRNRTLYNLPELLFPHI